MFADSFLQLHSQGFRFGYSFIQKLHKMKNLLLLFLFIFLGNVLLAQYPGFPDPDKYLIGDKELPKVLLVGSFHFAYYNLDAHKVAEEDQVDILSPQKQKEVEALVDYIARFKPTKIAVETKGSTSYLINKYEEWKSGKSPLGKSETRQIGFRLMDRFNLDTLYGVDSWGIVYDLHFSKDSNVIRPYLDTIFHEYDYQNDDPISQAYKKYMQADDSLTLNKHLLDYFKWMNSEKVLDRGFGAYLNGDFKNGEYNGADALLLNWYSRNLRIYRNIQEITSDPSDRILVIFGAGHMEILKHLFKCSPQYEWVDFLSLEKDQ